jgi:putative membrane protein
MKNYTPHVLLAVYLLVFAVCAISPHDRSVWWAENLPIMGIVLALVILYRFLRFSSLSYIMMFFLIIMHTIGGHFTFERVPFDFITDLFGFSRNHYDRVAHFTVGFYAYPLAELLLRKRLVSSRWILFLFPLFTIVAVAGLYEVFEWLYAVSADESAGIAVLGSQGDVWDAQKDVLADSLGAIFALVLFRVVKRKQVADLGRSPHLKNVDVGQ